MKLNPVIYKNKCTTCHGNGITNKEEMIDIKIPSGVQDGMSMVFQGMGQAIKNGTSGSLVVNFNEIHYPTHISYYHSQHY